MMKSLMLAIRRESGADLYAEPKAPGGSSRGVSPLHSFEEPT
jgi:hypothetical protein